jgi:hypothetical protein
MAAVIFIILLIIPLCPCLVINLKNIKQSEAVLTLYFVLDKTIA